MQGDLAGAVAQFGEVAAEAEAAHDEIWRVISLGGQSMALAYQGEAAAARAAAEAALEGGAELGGGSRYSGTRRWDSRPWPPGMSRRRTRRARPPSSTRLSGAGGSAAHLECRGRAGRRGSRRRPPLGRRGRLDYDGLVPGGGADDARPGGDRAG